MILRRLRAVIDALDPAEDAVQVWIDLLPNWQSDRACRVAAVVTRQVPNVHKAVKWHEVWYGVPGVDVPEIETRPNVISKRDAVVPSTGEPYAYDGRAA